MGRPLTAVIETGDGLLPALVDTLLTGLAILAGAAVLFSLLMAIVVLLRAVGVPRRRSP